MANHANEIDRTVEKRAAVRRSGAETATLQERFADAAARRLGRGLRSWRPVAGGYSTAVRVIVTCDDGTLAFVKGAADARTAAWLRTEYRVYSEVQATFLPALRGWEDDGASPFLVLEDLSDAVWQAAWTEDRIARVWDTVRRVAATPPPPWLPTLEDRRASFSGWAAVEQAPEEFLRLGLCSRAWLADAIRTLVVAEARVQLAGDELLHGDVRSDNVCFAGDRVVLVDWNWACRGNAILDVAGRLPSLALEGGPPPDAMLPGQPDVAAAISGFFAAQAGRPEEEASADIRAVQRAQLEVALPWAARALGLPPP